LFECGATYIIIDIRCGDHVMMPPSTPITFEQLSKYFHLPINDVAKELGICATMLKKICRRNGIPRWPHRKVVGSSLLNVLLMFVYKDKESQQDD
jgi:hypothetical protein